jgi:Leucine Rich repeat
MSASHPDPAMLEPRRFSIRSPTLAWIVLATVVLAVVAGGLGIGIPIWRQHAASREIERLGGSTEVRNDGPEWLQEFMGPKDAQIFNVITRVRLGGTDFGDGNMQVLSGLATVERLALFNTRVTDSGLVHVRGLRNLKGLYLHGTRVTDAGLSPLKALSQLQVLDLAMTGITDTGLAQIREIRSLERLYVEGTQVTDAGIAELQRALPGLKIIK